MAFSLWGIIKGLLVQDETDRTKQLSLEIDPTATTGTKTTVKAQQTDNRTITLPDATDTLVGKDTTDTLTNKSIDADTNTLSNLEVDNLKSGVLNLDLSGPATDDQLPSALAVKIALEAQNEANEIAYDNSTSGLTATNVQAAIDEVEGRLDSAETAISDHISETTGAHAASAISVNPTGNLASFDTQAALEELQGDIDGINNSAITELTGEVTALGPGSVAATIAYDTVDNNKLANMPANTLKGNNTGGVSDPLDLTATEATAMLDEMVGDSGSGGTKGLVPAPAAGDAAASKFLKADGTWEAVVSGANQQLSNLSSVDLNENLTTTKVSDLLIQHQTPTYGVELNTANNGAGDSGSITLETGTASVNRGDIFLNARQINIGASIVPNITNTYSLGIDSGQWSQVNTRLVKVRDGIDKMEMALNGTPPSVGSGLYNSLYVHPTQNLAIYTRTTSGLSGSLYIETGKNSSIGGATNTGLLNIQTGAIQDSGNAGTTGALLIKSGDTVGTGNSGDITVQTGTVVGGTRGKIKFQDGSLAGASNGYVWTLSDQTTGAGEWAVATGGGGSSGTSGLVQYSDGAGGFLSDSLFKFDDINNRLGIGIASPATPLHISASAQNEKIRINDGGVDANYLAFRNTTAAYTHFIGAANDSGTGVFGGSNAYALQIGTTQPNQNITFHTNNVTLPKLRITDTAVEPEAPVRAADGSAAAPAYSFLNSSSTGLYQPAANQLGFSVSGSNRMTMTEIIQVLGILDRYIQQIIKLKIVLRFMIILGFRHQV